jgi:hypothetical protein
MVRESDIIKFRLCVAAKGLLIYFQNISGVRIYANDDDDIKSQTMGSNIQC